jgi:putative pyruvate formate lyase activating enzyme
VSLKNKGRPAYWTLANSGELKKRIRKARRMLEHCVFCPRHCGVNRIDGETGCCGAGYLPRISSYNDHHGEEPPISGTGGSGTIFFSHCPVRCHHCQNYPISHFGHGREFSFERLAGMMVALQQRGCHNINFVTSSHFTYQILESLQMAVEAGLRVPLVLNSSGYESPAVLALLEGVIDIYLPDIKYGDDRTAARLTGIRDFAGINRAAVLEMYRQVGDLVFSEEGLAARGLIVRHLVLPNGLAGSEKVFAFLAGKISPRVYVSLMSQYFPAFKAADRPELSRRLHGGEYETAKAQFFAAGLENCWLQELD